ncbi:putative toxin-antitoxin system toxin component, PIN family [Flavobacterium sp.]|uniref:putative toxin-antitoxin system toxin component, PIN family n=1 Tax=Flavobacterium sp. TaxID=239 RepID=UPI00286CC84D|nr:putative toxin-antitoxin system toxin component, PIN family [Flavobacterium sp.]
MQNNSFVLDTNIWVSAIITNSEKTLLNYIEEKKLQIYICPEMVNEIEDVLGRKKIKKHLILPGIEYVDLIKNNCENIQIMQRYKEAPDEDDNYLYDLCIETKSILVTGDKLLLSHISIPPIITISRFEFLSL